MHIIYADGIGTSGLPDGDSRSILYKVVERLLWHQPNHTVTRLRWPASMVTIGGKLSWTDASNQGVDGINKIIEGHPEQCFILLGYSGGCRVVHDWMDRNHQYLNKISAVGLMSDPFRPMDRKQHGMPETTGWGICGQRRGPIPDRTYWVTTPGDAIPDALPDAILRTPADASDVLPGQFLWDLRNHLHAGTFQLAWQIGVFRHNPLAWFMGLGPRLHQARLDIEGYLGGRHTTDYIKPFNGGLSPAHRLADSINWKINNA